MKTALLLLVVLLAAAAPLASSHAGHRHWATIPDGPYAAPSLGTPATFQTTDGINISYAVFLPIGLPAGAKVPVILSAGPYFGLLEERVEQPSTGRLTGFLVDNFVSHGYAVVAASVRGTGRSDGCMEIMSEREMKDIDELVTHLAGQPWSNGAVAITGKSYDGGVAWGVAQFGNPALKTIVPIAGVTDQGDLLVHDGVAEFRTPLFAPYLYYPFGFGLSPNDALGLRVAHNAERTPEQRAQNLDCPEAFAASAAGAQAAATGDTEAVPVLDAWWAERDFKPRVLANYRGSVFIVHGFKDFNVDPHQVVPLFNDLTVEKKMWFGQWAHSYPDDTGDTSVRSVRHDFPQVLKAWFDKHLKGMDVSTGPVAEAADALTNSWRSYPAWPAPTGSIVYNLRGDDTMTTGAGESFAEPIVTPAGTYWWWRDYCEQGTTLQPAIRPYPTFTARPPTSIHLSGVATAELEFDAATAGTVFAVLCSDNRVVSFGATNMLYDGVDDAPRPYVPGTPLTVRVEMEPAEETIPANARLTLHVHLDEFVGAGTGSDYGLTPTSVAAVLNGGTLTLPTT